MVWNTNHYEKIKYTHTHTPNDSLLYLKIRLCWNAQNLTVRAVEMLWMFSRVKVTVWEWDSESWAGDRWQVHLRAVCLLQVHSSPWPASTRGCSLHWCPASLLFWYTILSPHMEWLMFYGSIVLTSKLAWHRSFLEASKDSQRQRNLISRSNLAHWHEDKSCCMLSFLPLSSSTMCYKRCGSTTGLQNCSNLGKL